VGHDNLILSKKEAELAAEIAKREGITVEEAATKLMQAAIARRVRKRTGKGPAKVYGLKRR
jgi:hypothetical protein